MPILCGRIYLAPANYHLLIEQGYFALSLDAPVCHSRPSIDLLLMSAARSYHDKAIGIILTGANQDGAQGASMLKAQGGLVVIQDPATAEASFMPEAALAATKTDKVFPLEQIAPFLVTLVKRGQATFSVDSAVRIVEKVACPPFSERCGMTPHLSTNSYKR